MYCGTIVTEEGKEKKVNIDFEPFKPINTSLYLCDNKVWNEIALYLNKTLMNLILDKLIIMIINFLVSY